MALTGLDIYKLLPKTNCKDCGFPTCLAFAMKLAGKQAELDACPHVRAESRAILEQASAPPIRLVSIGSGERKLEVGNEIVLFRHDKTFYHEPGLFVAVSDALSEAEASRQALEVASYEVQRVGTALRLNGLAVLNDSDSPQRFASCVGAVAEAVDVPLVLVSRSTAAAEAALALVGSRRPLLHAARADNWSEMAALAKRFGVPLAISAPDLESLDHLVHEVTDAGVTDLILDCGTSDLAGQLEAQTALRRLAIKKNYRQLGHPTMAFCDGLSGGGPELLAAASLAICKYASVIVLPDFDPAVAYPLLTLRQNIYTDPQKPIQVRSDLYPIGEPGPHSPVLITTNFSLTYFTVSGEIDASGVPTWLLIADADGMSVLTAWAAGKFDAEKIAKTVRVLGIEERVTHRKLVIPGLVASLSGETEDELAGWQVVVGPREAIDLPRFLKSWRN